MTCNCVMFKTHNTCYHTGYKPTFHESEKKETVPLAIKRMHRWNDENRLKHQQEDEKRK